MVDDRKLGAGLLAEERETIISWDKVEKSLFEGAKELIEGKNQENPQNLGNQQNQGNQEDE